MRGIVGTVTLGRLSFPLSFSLDGSGGRAWVEGLVWTTGSSSSLSSNCTALRFLIRCDAGAAAGEEALAVLDTGSNVSSSSNSLIVPVRGRPAAVLAALVELGTTAGVSASGSSSLALSNSLLVSPPSR